MRYFILVIIFCFSTVIILAQSNLTIKKLDSSNNKLIYLIQNEKRLYLLTLFEASSQLIVRLNNKKGGKLIFQQKVNSGVSLGINTYTKGKDPILYIEVGSNVLYAHEIVFGKTIKFKKGLPMKGTILNEYYNKFLEKNDRISW
ncbi:hypothetical protein [Polluticaenibacter yanchengensis]|uniref:DUF4369 domain-containing protein n=1 Tax=Polluticaenibacter yanchengensis TaxID=3014562 RepID=A0ABT4UF82_9BACT|nr:hypothetical protein [Chitinophagaceae bacterium LY-5]